jgi:hypothetical protein
VASAAADPPARAAGGRPAAEDLPVSTRYAEGPIGVGVFAGPRSADLRGNNRLVQLDKGPHHIFTFPIDQLPDLLRVLEHVVHVELPDRPSLTPLERLEALETRALQLTAGFERLDKELHDQGNRIGGEVMKVDLRVSKLEEQPGTLRALVALEDGLYKFDEQESVRAVRAARLELEAEARR